MVEASTSTERAKRGQPLVTSVEVLGVTLPDLEILQDRISAAAPATSKRQFPSVHYASSSATQMWISLPCARCINACAGMALMHRLTRKT